MKEGDINTHAIIDQMGIHKSLTDAHSVMRSIDPNESPDLIRRQIDGASRLMVDARLTHNFDDIASSTIHMAQLLANAPETTLRQVLNESRRTEPVVLQIGVPSNVQENISVYPESIAAK